MRQFLPTRRSRAALLAAMLFLFAQWGAMAHAYSHDATVDSAATGGTGAAAHVCDDCLSYSPLLLATGGATALPSLEPQGRGIATRATARSLIERGVALAFRSRAPPRHNA